MTQNDKFRELLAKARSVTQDSLDSNITGFDEPDYVCKCEACERYRDLIGQIDAALAEPIEDCQTCAVSKAFHDVVVRERNAAWSEIEQLRGKAIRFDLDQAGIESRERDAVALVDARAEIKQLKEQLEWQSACTKALGQSQERLVKEIQRIQQLPSLEWANVCAGIMQRLASISRSGKVEDAKSMLELLDQGKTYVSRLEAEIQALRQANKQEKE
jgi:hypothetical protein